MVPAVKQKNPAAFTAAGAVTMALALIFVCAFLVVPVITGLICSFKEYNVKLGVAGSPWAGLVNYRAVLANGGFLRSAAWTAEFSAISAAVLFALALIAGYLLLAVGKIRWLRHALCTLLLFPLIVPGLLWAEAYRTLFGKDAIGAAGLMAAWCALKYVGLPALLVTAAVSRGRHSASVPPLAGGVAAIILLALFGRADYGFSTC